MSIRHFYDETTSPPILQRRSSWRLYVTFLHTDHVIIYMFIIMFKSRIKYNTTLCNRYITYIDKDTSRCYGNGRLCCRSGFADGNQSTHFSRKCGFSILEYDYAQQKYSVWRGVQIFSYTYIKITIIFEK